MIEFTDSTTGHIVIAKSRAVGLSNLDETREWDRVMEEIRRLVRSMEDREGMARALRVARAIAKMGASLREAAPLARWRAPPGSTGALLGSPGFRPPPAGVARAPAGGGPAERARAIAAAPAGVGAVTPQQLAEALGSFISWLKQRTGGTVVIVVRLPDGNTIAGWDSLDSPETAREVLEAAARAVPLSPKAPGHVLQ